MALKLIDVLKLETTGLVGIFTGCALSANIVDIPALRKVKNDEDVVRYWKEFYFRRSRLQEGLVITPLVTSTLVYFLDESDKKYLWLVGVGLFATIIPWSVFRMKPDRDKLLEEDVVQKQGGEWVRSKIEAWNKMHRYRSLIGFSVFGIFLYALRTER